MGSQGKRPVPVSHTEEFKSIENSAASGMRPHQKSGAGPRRVPTEYDRGSSTQGDRLGGGLKADDVSETAPNMQSALKAEDSSAEEAPCDDGLEQPKSNEDEEEFFDDGGDQDADLDDDDDDDMIDDNMLDEEAQLELQK